LRTRTFRRIYKFRYGRILGTRIIYRRGARKWSTIRFSYGRRTLLVRRFKNWSYNATKWRRYIAKKYRAYYYRLFARRYRYRLSRFIVYRRIYRRGSKKWSSISIYYGRRKIVVRNLKNWSYNVSYWRRYLAKRYPNWYYRTYTRVYRYRLGRIRVFRTIYRRGSKKWSSIRFYYGRRRLYTRSIKNWGWNVNYWRRYLAKYYSRYYSTTRKWVQKWRVGRLFLWRIRYKSGRRHW